MSSTPKRHTRLSQKDLPMLDTNPGDDRKNKVVRISDHSKSLFDDLTTWVELRLKLTQLELEDQMDTKINQVALGVFMAVLGLMAASFALVALALLIGRVLGDSAWGFLIVSVVLMIVVLLVRRVKPSFTQAGEKKVRLRRPSSPMPTEKR